MLIGTLSIQPARFGRGGPVEYFKRKRDSRGNEREPRDLFGDFDQFQECVALSEAAHPYLSYFISYKGEVTPPSATERREVHGIVLRWFASGLAEQAIMAIGIDHGNHEHGALLRHVVTPYWPTFQPYFHEIDGLGLSDLQWLINRRMNFRSPEDPRNYQLISLAGKKYRDEDLEFIKRLRFWVEVERRRPGGLETHDSFIRLLNKKGYSAKVINHPDAREEEDECGGKQSNRVWVETENFGNGSVVSIKGPLCNPDYTKTNYETSLAADRKRYQDFMANPFILWRRFLDYVRVRHARIRKKFPEFVDKCCDSESMGFEDLHPSLHLKPVVSAPATVERRSEILPLR